MWGRGPAQRKQIKKKKKKKRIEEKSRCKKMEDNGEKAYLFYRQDLLLLSLFERQTKSLILSPFFIFINKKGHDISFMSNYLNICKPQIYYETVRVYCIFRTQI